MSKYLFPVYKQIDIEFEKGKGAKLYDKYNNEYIDFTSGIGVNSLGHGNKNLIKAINKQAKELIHFL